MLTKAVFQSGFSWLVIREKWPDLQRSFDGFNVRKVAAYGDDDFGRFLADQGNVRNRRKILVTIENTRNLD